MTTTIHEDKEKVCCITDQDLPLSCPMPDTQIWDSHPRIYLPITKTSYMTCPYCGTTYHLIKNTST